MNIKILCVGNIKEKYYVDAIAEYTKRLTKFCNISVVELKEERLPSNYTNGDIDRVKTKESERLRNEFDGFVILLDIWGERYDSLAFAKKIDKIMLSHSSITFVIGGSFGVCQELKDKVNMKLSFSDFTLPHQLMRVVLVEQVYRAFTINNNITYHK